VTFSPGAPPPGEPAFYEGTPFAGNARRISQEEFHQEARGVPPADATGARAERDADHTPPKTR